MRFSISLRRRKAASAPLSRGTKMITPPAKFPFCRLKNFCPNANRQSSKPVSCLIWAPIHANMGGHIMKKTIEIADDLFERAQELARKEKTTFRSLTEQGLRLVLKEKQGKPAKWK